MNSRDKLKNRLNVKFQPIPNHRLSLKKLQKLPQKQKSIQDTNQLIKNRSSSQIKLPSIQYKRPRMPSQRSDVSINIVQIRNKVKSIKNIPSIRVQSKAPINDTITYLLKNQILTIPQIVALLQKSKSDQFLYMKVIGIYQYEVCDEKQKGKTYVTVSSNGMVLDGQLIHLQTLVHQFQVYSKLKKIDFYRNFAKIKFLNKWNRGSKKAKFVQTRKKISKVLNLQNPKLLDWKKQLISQILIQQPGGWLKQGWVKNIAQKIFQIRNKVHFRLAQIAYQMLNKFDLPLSSSTDLMNRVLGNLVALNMSFEKKIRIQKELQIFYKLSRYLQFFLYHSIGTFVLQHLNSLIDKIYDSTQLYKSSIICYLQQLDINKQSYTSDRQKILINSPATFDIDFKVDINQDFKLALYPNNLDLQERFIDQIKEFINIVDSYDLTLVRNKSFDFVTKNVIKGNNNEENQKNVTLKEYLYSLPDYFSTLSDLKLQLGQFNIATMRRIKLIQPFLDNYKKFIEQPKQVKCVFQEIQNQIQRIDDGLEFNNKLQQGQYFLFGYLNQNQLKDKIKIGIQKYKKRYLDQIPIMLKSQKQILYDNIMKHLEIMSLVITSPALFITVSNQSEIAEELIPQLSLTLVQIERIQQIYNRVAKSQLPMVSFIKNQLQNLRVKTKNFKQTRQNSFAFYRRQLQTSRKTMIQKVSVLNLRQEAFYSLSQKPIQVYEKILKSLKQLQSINQQLVVLNELQIFYALKTTSIPKLQVLILEYQILQEIWRAYKFLTQTQENILTEIVSKVSYKQIMKQFETGLKKLQKYVKNIQYNQLCKHLIQRVQKYLSCLQIIQDIQAQHLRPKDINEINLLIQKEHEITVQCRNILVGLIFQENLLDLKIPINQVIFKARKQIQIEEMLQSYKTWWKKMRLQYKELQQYPLVIIFGQNDKIRRQVQEHTTLLVNILNHKYGSFARKQCNQLLRQMNNLGTLLQLTIIHQEKFLSLYPILTSKYAQKQFSTEYKKFDSILTKTMKNVKALIKPTESINEQTRSLLNNHIKQFDQISSVLSHFLQKKRVKFQRFYFLQDDQMLQVLVGIAGQSNIFRMFDGIKGWLTNKQGAKIGVQGVGGQQLILKGWSYRNQEPQLVFKQLQDSIKTTLNSIVRHVLFGYEMQLKQLRNLYQNIPWMCIYTVQMVLYTKQIQLNCFQQGISLQVQLGLIQQTINNASASPIRNANYITMLLFLHHFTQELYHKQVDSVFRFQWNSFLRYYHDNQTVTMRALGGQHTWGGQYQGFWNLMINTSDIRRAHACILGNLKYGNGVLLQGPAGTGKTETLKQLARCMAKYCVLFNCSSQINIKTLQKLLSGLCYTASWLCLDQINRLTTEVMSVVANQIMTIRNAISIGKQVFNFMGKDIRLRAGVGIFATMNPIYLRRAKLTENLKQYFRVISVNVPDYSKIMEVMLYSLNFTQANTLSKRISKMFQNLSIQLDDHPQYDFGLRAMRFLIYNIEKIRNKYRQEEDAIIDGLIRAFYGRLDPDDVKTFEKVIMDTFMKNVEFPSQEIMEKVKSMKQSPQTGIIVLGPTSTKTTLINMYINSMKPDVRSQKYSPNSMQLKFFMGQSLMGRWQQGIVEKMARDSLSHPKLTHVLVLDSLIKSQKIQNFNTLLDDSKILSLPNGTRLKVHNNFKVIMQTPDLSQSSPATITRCNVIYVSQKQVSMKAVRESLIPHSISESAAAKIRHILQCLDFSTILKVKNIYPLFMFPEYQTRQWNQANALGYQKVLIFSIQLLGQTQAIKKYIHKDNALSNKKNIYHHTISFQKYQEGQFVELISDFVPIKTVFDLYIPTAETRFYDWVNKRAIKLNSSILWKGKIQSGKTKAITYSLQGQNYVKIPMTKFMSSKALVDLLQQKISTKKQMVLRDQIIIYVENIGLSNEQSTQNFRFIQQYRKIFIQKTGFLNQVIDFAMITQCNFENYVVSRLARHFAQINMPSQDQHNIKFLFSSYLKSVISRTKTSPSFKTSLDLEIDKITAFLNDIAKKNQSIGEQTYGHYYLLKPLSNLRILTQKNAKQITDMFLFLFNELRLTQFQHGHQKGLNVLKLSYSDIFKGKYQNQYNDTLKTKLYFTSFINGVISKVDNWELLKQKLQKQISQTNYLSDFIIQQVLTIMRVLDWVGGHYCLTAPPGIGKKTMFKIACKLNGNQIQQIPIFQNSKERSTWIFNLLKRTFEKKRDQVIIIDFNENNYDQMLQILQKINSGYPSKQIFNSQLADYAYVTIQQHVEGQYDKHLRNYDQVIDDYVNLAKKGIRILFSSQSKNVNKIKNYHYLNKLSTKRVLDKFPSESLSQISKKILFTKIQDKANLSKIQACIQKIYNDLQNLIKDNQSTGNFHAKFNQINLFKFIQHYSSLSTNIATRYRQKQDIINRSILKVNETSETLSNLKQELVNMEPQIKQKKQKIVEVVPILQQKKKVTQQVKYIVQSQSRQIQFKTKEVQALMKDVQAQIDKAQPLMVEANQSISSIKRSQLSQIKNNTNPHPLIKFTLQNLVILLGQSENWENIKKVVSDSNLMMKIKNCSPNQASYLKVKKRIEQNHDWSVDSVSKISVGSRHICKWIIGLIKFQQIKTQVQDKRKVVDGLKIELQQSQRKAKFKLNQLQQKQKAVKQIQNQYNRNINETNRLQQLLEINKERYRNAERISSNLAESLMNWKNKLSQIKQFKNHMEGHSIIICSFLYIYPSLQFEEKQKMDVLIKQNIKNIGLTFDSKFDPFNQVKEYLIPQEKLKILTYEQMNNPKIIQMMYHWEKRPLLLDPDNQATKWIEKNYENKCTTTRDSFLGSIKSVQHAIKQGLLLVLLVENNFDKFTNDILNSKITQTSNRVLIQYNKNLFYMHSDFRIILCNKSRNPNIVPKHVINHQIINFQVTQRLIKNDLLSQILKFQNQQMYQNKIKMELDRRSNEQSLKQIDNRIIQSLISNKKLLVDDYEFISLLSQSQMKGDYLKKNATQLANNMNSVQRYLSNYQNVCQQASLIYSSLKKMSKISNLLNWSIQIFIQYFKRAVTDSVSIQTQFQQVFMIQQQANYQYDHYSISLSNSRPQSALSMISNITSKVLTQERRDDFDDSIVLTGQFQNLVGLKEQTIDLSKAGIMTKERQSDIINSLISSLKNGFNEEERMIWGMILVLADQSQKDVKILIQNMKKRKFKQYLDFGQATQNIKKYFSKIDKDHQLHAFRILSDNNPFQKYSDYFNKVDILMLCKMVKPHEFSELLTLLIKLRGYQSILSYEQADVIDWFQKSDNQHPIMLIMGQDPLHRITDYLGKKKYKNVILIPMGQGQTKTAQIVLQKQSRKQNLVILHNLHISQSFYPFLSKTLQQFHVRPPHKNFRLVLITNMTQNIPSNITASCHKYLMQQPSGLQNRVKYLHDHFPIQLSFPAHRQIQYAMSFFHSLVNQLNQYKPSGWVHQYNFNTSDYIYAVKVFKEIVQSSLDINRYECNIDIQELENTVNHDLIDFNSLKYLIGQVAYVGKLADDMDREKMRIYVNKFLTYQILTKNHKFFSLKQYIMPETGNQKDIQFAIKLIPEEDPKIYGLHQKLKPNKKSLQFLLNKFREAYFVHEEFKSTQVKEGEQINLIFHKFEFINKQIQKYNQNLSAKQGNFLRQLTPISKIFSLKAFFNPRQFFTEIKKQTANKNGVQYGKVQLIWGLVSKDNSFGISGLKLQGGTIKNNNLQDGYQEYDITLYVYAMVKKKEKEVNKKLVQIPLYLNAQRQGKINSYGDNVNLVTMIKLQSNHTQQFWTLRGAAFIVL